MYKHFLILIVFFSFSNSASFPAYAQKQTKSVKKTEQGISDPKARQVLQNTQKWLNGLNSLKASFSYSLENKAKKIKEVKKGDILISGNKFALDFMGLKIYCDGNTIWSYNPKAKEVSINEFSNVEGSMNPLSIIQSYEKSYRSKWIRDEVIDGKMRILIDLIPIGGASFHKMRLVITQTDNQLYQSDVYDKNGSIYTYTIHKYEVNPKIDATTFTFDAKKNPGVEINDMR